MKIEYQCTAAEFAEAYGTAWKTLSRRLLRYWTIAMGGLLVLLAAWRIQASKRIELFDVVALLLGVFWIGCLTFLRDWYVRGHFAKHPNLQQPFRVDVSEGGVRFASDNGTWDLRWTAYTKVIETKNLFVLYQGDCDFSFLPKHAFAQGQVEEFRDLLRRRIPRH